jgi:hypothetical protein
MRTTFQDGPDDDNAHEATWQPQMFGPGASSKLGQPPLFSELRGMALDRMRAKRLHARRIEAENLLPGMEGTTDA